VLGRCGSFLFAVEREQTSHSKCNAMHNHESTDGICARLIKLIDGGPHFSIL
jgi:hypothetical protein